MKSRNTTNRVATFSHVGVKCVSCYSTVIFSIPHSRVTFSRRNNHRAAWAQRERGSYQGFPGNAILLFLRDKYSGGTGPSPVWPLLPALNTSCEAVFLGLWGPLGKRGDKPVEENPLGERWQNGKMVLHDILRSCHQPWNCQPPGLCDIRTLMTAQVAISGYSVTWSEIAVH